ncbi:molybdopterin-binding protein [Streptomyces sp. x-80]|uniref:molybdopterin molybdotransferase MoeA n=1 Tax=Streptomyces sp. x-80 TaxID=2789282 RepID=UPI003980BF1C
MPDMHMPDVHVATANMPDTHRMDTRRMDTHRMDTHRMDTHPLDARTPDGCGPDTYAPDAHGPDTYRSDVYGPDAGVPHPAAADIPAGSAPLTAPSSSVPASVSPSLAASSSPEPSPGSGPAPGAGRGRPDAAGGPAGTPDPAPDGAPGSNRPAGPDRPSGHGSPSGPHGPDAPHGTSGPDRPSRSTEPGHHPEVNQATQAAQTPGTSGPTSSSPAPSPTTPGRSRKRHPAPSSWQVARGVAARAVRGPRAPETSAFDDALGRTLAAPLTALTDLPSFDTSAMDGWAVSGPGPWHLDRATPADGGPHPETSHPETSQPTSAPAAPAPPAAPDPGILAGHAPTRPLPDGHAVRIATGARVPAGATAVLRSEHGEVRDLGDGRARLHAPAPATLGQDIRPRGQECGRGDQLLPAGALVTPAVLGLAAAAGYDELATYPRPRVEVLVLGDELLRHGLPQEGRIRDALGPMLAPWLRALGAVAPPPRHLADDADALYAAIEGSTADVVITTGGTASGPVDHVHPTLRRLGAEILVDGVAVRPGHPMLLARLTPERHLVGLPGNPLAAVSGLLTLAEPLLRTLAARPTAPAYRAPLAAAVPGHPRDTRLVPVACRDDDRYGRTVAPLHFTGPAMLRGIAVADALAVIPPGGQDRGAAVELLELPWSAGRPADGPGDDGPYDPGAGPDPTGAAGRAHPVTDPHRSPPPAPPAGGSA